MHKIRTPIVSHCFQAWKESFEDEEVTQDFDLAPELPLVVKFGDVLVEPGVRIHTDQVRGEMLLGHFEA